MRTIIDYLWLTFVATDRERNAIEMLRYDARMDEWVAGQPTVQ